MWVLLVPLIGLILLCRYTDHPVNLMADTEFAYLDSLHTYRAVLTDYPSPRRKTWRAEACLLSREDTVTQPLHTRVLLYLAGDSLHPAGTLSLGDTLLLRARVCRAGRIGSFDYGAYLRMQGIAGTAYVPVRSWRCLGHSDVRFSPKAWQHHAAERLRRMPFAPRELGTLQALTLGYKEDIEPDVKRSFQASGAAHVLAVSGLHTGIVYTIVWGLLTCFGWRKPLYEQHGRRWILSIGIVLALWGYALMTGMTPSVVRATLMLTILQLGYACRRETLSLNTLAAAAVLILVFRPRDLFNASFQLSFMAVFAILCLLPVLKPYVPNRLPLYRKWLDKGYRWLREMLLVTLAAWLGTMPLTTFYFGYCSNYFLLGSLLELPLAWLAVVGGLASLVLGTVPVIGTGIVWLTDKVVWLMNTSVGWIDSLPGAVTAVRITPPMIGLLYGAIAFGALTLRRSPWYAAGAAACLSLFGYLYITI